MPLALSLIGGRRDGSHGVTRGNSSEVLGRVESRGVRLHLGVVVQATGAKLEVSVRSR